MNPKHLLSTILLLLFTIVAHANIFRVNSSLATDVSQKLFKTINEANSNASVLAGDTLMIESSPIAYANATITKPLVLIGPGYFLTQNPQTQADGSLAIVQEIDISATGSGSVLEGLSFSSGYFSNVPHLKANNVIITRCYLLNPIQIDATVSNITISQNYSVLSAVTIGYFSNTSTGMILKNNFIGGDIDVESGSEYQRIFSSVENNIFGGKVNLTTTTFRSNIITSSSATITVTSANIQNNLTAGGQLTSIGSGNITYTSSSLFVGATGNSTDGQYKLQPTYIASGYNGTQPGLFGGTQPYVLSGIPPVPSIYEFMADDAANKQTGLPVSIKVKVNP